MDGGDVPVGNRQEIVHTEARPPQTLRRHASRCSHSTRACVRRRSTHGGVQSGTATFVAFRPVTNTDIDLRGEHLPPGRGWFGKPPTVGVAMQSRLPAHPRRDQIRHQWMIDQRGAGSQAGKDVGAGWDRQGGCGLSCSMTRTDPANPPNQHSSDRQAARSRDTGIATTGTRYLDSTRMPLVTFKANILAQTSKVGSVYRTSILNQQSRRS